MKAKRAQGVIVTEAVEPTGVLAAEAEEILRRKQEEREARAERREERYRTMPNRVCYADTAFKDWKEGDNIPPCIKCGALLHPEEHHDCPGFHPRYQPNKPSPEERMKMRRAGWLEAGDWDDDQYDPTTPDETTGNLRMRHEDETGETFDQVVIEGMTW
jgi:hypothetical protein